MKQKQEEERIISGGHNGYYDQGNQGSGSGFNQPNGDPFSNFGQGNARKTQQSINNDGFLDFDNAFGNGNQSKNPFG